jgi:hypothetical protein
MRPVLDKLRRFAAHEPVIISTTLAIVSYIVTRLITDQELASLIVALITAIIGTAAARASVYTKPSAVKLEREAWREGATQALYVRPPMPDEIAHVDATTRTVRVTRP